MWTFVDPTNGGVSFGIYVAGAGLSYLAFLFGAIAIRMVKIAPKAAMPAAPIVGTAAASTPARP
jgi:hypothetical protein